MHSFTPERLLTALWYSDLKRQCVNSLFSHAFISGKSWVMWLTASTRTGRTRGVSSIPLTATKSDLSRKSSSHLSVFRRKSLCRKPDIPTPWTVLLRLLLLRGGNGNAHTLICCSSLLAINVVAKEFFYISYLITYTYIHRHATYRIHLYAANKFQNFVLHPRQK